MKKNVKGIFLFISICMLWTLANASPTPAESISQKVQPADLCEYPDKEFRKILSKMRDCFYRNLPTAFACPKNTTVKFFLTADGVVRDATVEISSGNKDVDKMCLDAIYCASPFAPPPLFRSPLPPPPEGAMLPPDFYGCGVYRFTFEKSDKKVCATPRYEFALIPFEIFYRYPNLFKLKELDSPSNKLEVPVDSELLDSVRFQWKHFYDRNPQPTKEQVKQWAEQVADFYLKKGVAATLPVNE